MRNPFRRSAARLARIPAVLLLACSALAISACSASTREYRPRTDLVAQTGLIGVAQALQRALEDVQAPVISAVHFGAAALAFTCQPSSVGDERFSSQHRVIRTFRCRQPDMHLDLRALTRIDILQPQHFLVLRTSTDAVLATLMPNDNEHALRLVDLLASLRTALDDAQSVPFSPLAVHYVRETQQTAASSGAH